MNLDSNVDANRNYHRYQLKTERCEKNCSKALCADDERSSALLIQVGNKKSWQIMACNLCTVEEAIYMNNDTNHM